MIDLATLLLFPALMAFAASSDIFTMTISNRISALLAVAFFAMALALDLPAEMIAWNLACGAAMLALTIVLFAFGWIGGGDAKLATATALWLGWSNLLDYGATASVLGGLLTIAIIQLRRMQFPAWLMSNDWFARLHARGNGVPYGVALAAAGLLVYPNTSVWLGALGR